MEEFLHSPLLILAVMVLYFVLMSIYKPAYTRNGMIKTSRSKAGVILLFVFCLFSVQDTDYFHYMDCLNMLKYGVKTHLEDVYAEIAEFVDYSNLWFRTVVWGSALSIFLLSVKHLGIKMDVVLFFFVTIFITKFSYARVSLAMAMGMCGYALLVKPLNNKALSFPLGITIIACSLMFHKSAIFWIAVFCCSVIKLNKQRMIILLVLYPLCAYIFQKYAVQYFMKSAEEALVETAMGYLEEEEGMHGLSYCINIILTRIPYYLLLFSIIKSILTNKYAVLANYEKRIVNVAFYVICFSSFFLFDTEANTNVMYYRLLYYSILPLSLLAAIFHKHGFNPRLTKMSVIIGSCSIVYFFLYSFYTSVLFSHS
jgi:hypothetical protein